MYETRIKTSKNPQAFRSNICTSDFNCCYCSLHTVKNWCSNGFDGWYTDCSSRSFDFSQFMGRHTAVNVANNNR